jgi:hypothetical protein
LKISFGKSSSPWYFIPLPSDVLGSSGRFQEYNQNGYNDHCRYITTRIFKQTFCSPWCRSIKNNIASSTRRGIKWLWRNCNGWCVLVQVLLSIFNKFCAGAIRGYPKDAANN